MTGHTTHEATKVNNKAYSCPLILPTTPSLLWQGKWPNIWRTSLQKNWQIIQAFDVQLASLFVYKYPLENSAKWGENGEKQLHYGKIFPCHSLPNPNLNQPRKMEFCVPISCSSTNHTNFTKKNPKSFVRNQTPKF